MSDFAYLIALVEGRIGRPEGKSDEKSDPKGAP